MTRLEVVVGLAAAAVLLYAAAVLVEWRARRAARQRIAARPAEVVALAGGLPMPRRPLPVDPPVVVEALRAVEAEALERARGRHRRDEAGAAAVSATGILRRVRAEGDQLPELPRPTGDQLRQATR